VIGWLTAKNCRNKILKKVFAGQKAEKFLLRPLSVAERGLFLWHFFKIFASTVYCVVTL